MNASKNCVSHLKEVQPAAQENSTDRGCGPQVTYNHILTEASNCGLQGSRMRRWVGGSVADSPNADAPCTS